MTAGEDLRWNWSNEGFKFEPRRILLRRPIDVYRVWGGSSSEEGNSRVAGVCYCFEQPTSRKEAEGLTSVWEWGNACRFITPFRIEAGATIYIGRVHPGDYYDHGLGAPGSQVFVEQQERSRFVRRVGPPRNLINDLGPYYVLPYRKDPGPYRSS
jgi:hypothetical protein